MRRRTIFLPSTTPRRDDLVSGEARDVDEFPTGFIDQRDFLACSGSTH